MTYLLWLKQDHPELALAEALALTDGKVVELAGDVVVIDGNSARWERLGLTRAVGESLLTCDEKELEQALDASDWNNIITDTFKVTVHHTDLKPKTMADRIWHKLEKRAIDLRKPDTLIDAFFADGRVFVGKRLWTNTEKFEERRPHQLPATHPSGMHPKIARAIINLTGAAGNGKLIDPFCGAGGFLIEAKRMGLRAEGSDVDDGQVERANTNLKPYRVTATRRDALTMTEPIDYLASDLPYGRNTKTTDTDALYRAFLILLGKLLRKRAVLVFPDFADYKLLVVGSGLSVVATYPIYVHKSLTRNVVVLERN
jgi:tRNA (guanine10-N2)-dimethyltransferase